MKHIRSGWAALSRAMARLDRRFTPRYDDVESHRHVQAPDMRVIRARESVRLRRYGGTGPGSWLS